MLVIDFKWRALSLYDVKRLTFYIALFVVRAPTGNLINGKWLMYILAISNSYILPTFDFYLSPLPF